jgi:signal transduction histidine kinase
MTASVMLPVDVADTIVELLLASLRFSVRESRDASERICRAEPLGADGIRVVLEDDGSGFDLTTIREQGGAGLDAVARLRALEGRVDVRSAPGEGMSLVVSWGSIVMSGTALPEDELTVRS